MNCFDFFFSKLLELATWKYWESLRFDWKWLDQLLQISKKVDSFGTAIQVLHISSLTQNIRPKVNLSSVVFYTAIISLFSKNTEGSGFKIYRPVALTSIYMWIARMRGQWGMSRRYFSTTTQTLTLLPVLERAIKYFLSRPTTVLGWTMQSCAHLHQLVGLLVEV